MKGQQEDRLLSAEPDTLPCRETAKVMLEEEEAIIREPHQGWDVPASRMARDTHNPIRAIVENLSLEPNQDKPMIALSIGDPTVFGNLSPPQEVIDALCASVKSLKYNGYTSSVGYEEARTAVAKYSSSEELNISPKDVLLCSGCSCALDLCITVLANPGQNIVVPRPGFSIYRTLAEGMGVKVRHYDLKPESGWEADLEQLEAALDSQTAALIVNNPSNPCGSVYSRQHLEDIVAVAERARVPIIADEIYEHFVFPGQSFVPLAAVSKHVPVLSCSGLTKRFLVPGWRMGWVVIHDRNGAFDKEVRCGLQRLSQRIIGSNTVVQGALPAILSNTPSNFYTDTVRHVQSNAELAFSALSQVPGVTPIMPQGAMYMMVGLDLDNFPLFNSELRFVEQMVTEESVFCLPGQYPGYVRLVLTVPEDILREALERIATFCERHYNIDTNRPLPSNEKTSAPSPPTEISLPMLIQADEDRRP